MRNEYTQAEEEEYYEAKQEGFIYEEITSRFGVSKWSIAWFFRTDMKETLEKK